MVFNAYTNISLVNTNDIVLYIDECLNIDNIYCENPDNHDYVLNYNNAKISYKEIVREGEEKEVTTIYYYEITVESDVIKELDTNMKYIKMFVTTEYYANDYADGIYYDPNILYNAEIKMLRKYCQTCLDDRQMQLLMLIVFKRQLLEQAIATSHNKEALQFYLDLCKLLNVSINTKTVNTGCKVCVNGVCKL